jgi:hypothetical protein
MQEIAPGLWHWTARHPHIGSPVSSYYLRPERVALDPLLPDEGLEWFQGAEPEHGDPVLADARRELRAFVGS